LKRRRSVGRLLPLDRKVYDKHQYPKSHRAGPATGVHIGELEWIVFCTNEKQINNPGIITVWF
jgi:hypothetical protein